MRLAQAHRPQGVLGKGWSLGGGPVLPVGLLLHIKTIYPFCLCPLF